MSTATYDFEIEQGTTLYKQFTWKATGSPVDLTGYTARMQVRPSVTSSTVLLELTTTNGGIVLGGALGTITLSATAVQTAALPRGGVYDIELVNGSVVTRFIRGTITLSKEVTR